MNIVQAWKKSALCGIAERADIWAGIREIRRENQLHRNLFSQKFKKKCAKNLSKQLLRFMNFEESALLASLMFENIFKLSPQLITALVIFLLTSILPSPSSLAFRLLNPSFAGHEFYKFLLTVLRVFFYRLNRLPPCTFL